jgi:hypothetical protein
MLSPLRNRAGMRLREPFGKAGLTVAVIALVFAMMGGAYAASNGGGNATSSAKKGPRGPKGPKGDTGPAGAQGPAGAKGDAGSPGADGKGAEAVSFTGSKGPIAGVTCTEGGVEVKSADGTTLVCNGKKGKNGLPGAQGEPWTAGGLLPSGETETGSWGLNIVSKETPPAPETEDPPTFAGQAYESISFPIPLAESPEMVVVDSSHAEEGATKGCPGIVNGLPVAEEGSGTLPKLCVYFGPAPTGFTQSNVIGRNPVTGGLFGNGSSRAGAVLWGICQQASCAVAGTWAATAK